MKTVLALPAGILVLLFALTQPASGQTPPPNSGSTVTPIPTAVPTLTLAPLPSGGQLISQMKSIVKAKGSAHVESYIAVAVGSLSVVESPIHVDLSWQRSQVRAKLVTHSSSGNSQTTTVQHISYASVGNRTATRRDHHAWQCATSRSYVASLLLTLAGFLHAHGQDAQNLGAETVDGTAVWHVRTTQPEPLDISSGRNPRQPVDYYISQSDSMVVRMTLTESVSTETTVALVEIKNDYSSYGETVSVTLPKPCR
jgi:hypothetical protein